MTLAVGKRRDARHTRLRKSNMKKELGIAILLLVACVTLTCVVLHSFSGSSATSTICFSGCSSMYGIFWHRAGHRHHPWEASTLLFVPVFAIQGVLLAMMLTQ